MSTFMEDSMVLDVPPAASVPVARPRRWAALASLAAASFIDRGEDQTLSILWPQIHQSLGASVGGLGPILSIGKLVNTLMLPLWGFATDRWSRRLLLVCFTGLWGLWTLAISLVDTLPQLLMVRLISSLGLGVFPPAAFSLIGDLYPSQQRGRAAGIIQGVGIIGTIIAFGVLPALAARDAEAWRWGFVLMGFASVLTGILLLLSVSEPARGAAEPELRDVIQRTSAGNSLARWTDLSALASIPSWRLLLATEAFRSLGASVFIGWLFTWLAGLGLGPMSFVIAIMSSVGIIVGNLVFGALGDRLDQRFPRYGRVTLMFAGTLSALPTMMLFLASDGQNMPRLIVFGVLSGLSGAAAVVLWPIGQAIVPPELRGSSRAIIDMLAGIAGAMVLGVSGLLADRIGVAPMLLLLTPLPSLLSILAWLPMFRTYSRDRAALRQMLEQRRVTLLGGND